MTEQAPVVTVATGSLKGARSNGIDHYLGIPYAAPPVGENRFAPPVPPAAWKGKRDATVFGPTAPHIAYPAGIDNYLPSNVDVGDDYLTVNVWAPVERHGRAPLPVLVFVHGGALTRGSANIDTYNGEVFARHGIVYVSVQYRLGQEGFAVLDDVPQNLGVLDQEAALRWVRREISAFGGDPARVTAMGHSAGAGTLGALLALPHASELFDRVILQSGPLSAKPVKKAKAMSQAVAQLTGAAPSRAGFASQHPLDLVEAQRKATEGGSLILGKGPAVSLVIGGAAVPENPADALIAGAGRDIPVMMGSTIDEYRLWFVPSGEIHTIKPMVLKVAAVATKVPGRIVKAHQKRNPEATPGEVLGEVITDMVFRAPQIAVANSRLGEGAAPTWVYEFVWKSPVDGLGAAHAIELGFVFDRVGSPEIMAMAGDAAPQALADAMHSAWVAFVKDGDPGWERWSSRHPVEVFDADGGHIVFDPRADEIEGLPLR